MLINAFRRWGYPEEYAREVTPHRWHPDYFAMNREGSCISIICRSVHELLLGIYTCQDAHFVAIESRDFMRTRRLGFHVRLSHAQDHEMLFQLHINAIKAWDHEAAELFRTVTSRRQLAETILRHKRDQNSWVLFARMLELENPEENT